jgi:hypothetical protein
VLHRVVTLMLYLGRLVLAVHCLVVGLALGWEHYVTGDSRGFALAFLWPLVFIAAGFAAAAYTFHPTSKAWWLWSGALLILAYGSRACTVFALAVETQWEARFVVGTATWMTLAALVGISWQRVAAPWVTNVRR